MRLVFLGPPGAGKGTYSDMISKRYGIVHLSTGDMLRKIASEKGKLSEEIGRIMKEGGLVSDSVMEAIVKKRLSEKDCSDGYILDGYPRDLNQADHLSGITDIDAVFYFHVSEDSVMERLGGRLTCSGCRAVYHTHHKAPEKEGICDKCGGRLYVREDQKPKAIARRLEVYRKETEPLIEYYDRKGILHRIDANPDLAHIDSIIGPCTDIIENVVKKRN